VHALHQQVAALLRTTAEEIVLPRFRNLATGEIEEKAPDDLVTIADWEAEVRLTEGLSALDPEARVIGEEACAADAALLDGIDRGRVWIIDPVDGTNNFASGRTPFGMMIALVEDGVTKAGWIYDPVADRLCSAALGGGAWVDVAQVHTRPTQAALPIAAISPYFLSEEERAGITERAAGCFTLADIPRCAAEQYPRLVLGVNDVALFQRTLPWDHAAGALFVTKAGGAVRRPDGSDYRVGDTRRGLIGASSPALWEKAAEILFG